VGSVIGQWDVYITQSVLVMITLLIYKSFNAGGGEEHNWQAYSFMSMILLGVSDVVVKNAIGYEYLLTNIVWFSLAAAIIPMISLYRKTGAFVFSYREKKREDNTGVVPLFLGLIGIFGMKMISQYVAIGIAPDSANVRAIGSLAVPLTAVISHYLRGVDYTIKDIVMFVSFAIVGVMSGVRSLL
jgi:drug/metabolite transporter (DMT)-like permease